MENNQVPIGKIIPDKNQPRKYFQIEKMRALKASIKEYGIANPLIVQAEGSNYLIVDGERRFRAATELGLKTVPVAVVTEKDEVGRLVEQFHIQEQHEGWSPTEKAKVVIALKSFTRKSSKEIADMLGIGERTMAEYLAFEKLQLQDLFLENGLSITHARRIQGLIRFIQEIKNEVLNEEFDKSDQKKLERLCIKHIISGDIERDRDYTKLKDSFKTNPKMIEKYLEGESTPEQIYVKSKARGAYYLRNAITNASYMLDHISRLMEEKDVSLSKKDVQILKAGKKHINSLLSLVGDTD